jgi:phosphoribosylaminoimidazole-succinocarboxamide synthase
MKEKIHKGFSKTLYQAEDENALLMYFEDHLKIKGRDPIEISGKGILTNSISSFIMQRMDIVGIDNHLIEKTNMRQQLVQFVDIFPIQIHICTLACGRYVTDFHLEEGLVFDSPMVDFRIKNSALNYPVINELQIISFGWLIEEELVELKKKATRVHDFLTGFFLGVGIRLVDCKLEFGMVFNGDDFVIMLADEISPDNCRLWDIETNKKLCFEIAEEDPEKVIGAYSEVLNRLQSKGVRSN